MLTRLFGILFLFFFSGCASVILEDYEAANYGPHAFSGIHDVEEEYNIGIFKCTVTLDPPKVREATASETTNWFNILSATYPTSNGWSYQSAINDLSNNSIEVKTYDARGNALAVGSDIHIRYVPKASDPDSDIHWVQVVQNNHQLNPGGHGVNDNKVDLLGAGNVPYYDTAGAADGGNCNTSCNFYDKPQRVDPLFSHNWNAVLYVVEAPAIGPGQVTLLAPAVSWGWRNSCELDLPIQDWWMQLSDESASFISNAPIAPDRSAQLEINREVSFQFSHGELDSTVTLTQLQLSIEVGPEPEPISSEAALINFSAEGSGRLSNFTLGNDVYRGVQLTLSEGTGVIQSTGGGMSATMDGEIVSENQDSIPITMFLYGQLVEDNYSVLLTAEATMIVPRN